MDKSSVSQVATLAVQILTPVVTLLVTWFVHRVIKMIESRWKIRLSTDQEAQIDGWVESAIRFAEEKAHQAAAQAGKLSGHEKLEHAASFVMGMVEKNGWDSWARDTIKAKVEAKLNDTRLP